MKTPNLSSVFEMNSDFFRIRLHCW